MSFDNPWQWSSTPASNTAITSIDITGATGKVKDGDNAIRAVMAGWASVEAKGSDVASAGTLTLGTQRYYHVTGTTTITDIDFTDAVDGRWAWLVFDGALTLTHNSTTLKLPGGASITTAGGDRALFIQDSSDNIICLDYIPAAAAPATVAVIRTQAFTGSGTYTPHANMLYCVIEVVGGGGAGGGTTTDATGKFITGGGGGSGAYSRLVASRATIGASQTVTIGAGGSGSSGAAGGNGSATSVGSLCTANGGTGGSVASHPAGGGGRGGAGGTAGTGSPAFAGSPGGNGCYSTVITFYFASGAGAPSYFGDGALPVAPPTGAAGNAAAANSGAGGSGSLGFNAIANAAGGNGGSGYVLITEFCSA